MLKITKIDVAKLQEAYDRCDSVLGVTDLFPGFGTVVNVATVIIGSAIGLLLGHRLPQRTRDTVTDALGLVTLLIGGLSAVEVTSSVLSAAVGGSAPVLIVLGSMLIGGIIGSLVDIERRLEDLLGGLAAVRFRRASCAEPGSSRVRDRVAGVLRRTADHPRFAVRRARSRRPAADPEGALDGFAAIAFAASLGVGVMASALAVRSSRAR